MSSLELVGQEGWFCYLLRLKNCNLSYIGTTNNITRRLEQHNGIRPGGARYTSSKLIGEGPGKWRVLMLVFFPAMGDSGVKEAKRWALKYEWASKRALDRRSILSGALRRRDHMKSLVTSEPMADASGSIVFDALVCPLPPPSASSSEWDGLQFLDHVDIQRDWSS